MLDSPANNTRSKTDGDRLRLGKPKRMLVLQDAGQAANKKSKGAKSDIAAKQEAAAERRRLMEEQKRADVAQKRADREAAAAQRRAAREAGPPARTGSAGGRIGPAGSGESVGSVRRTGSGDSTGSARRTGSAEDKPTTATRAKRVSHVGDTGLPAEPVRLQEQAGRSGECYRWHGDTTGRRRHRR